jgi:tRNA(Ile)-lysidine synthase
MKKSEILLADQRGNIPYTLDSTNFDQHYQRNKVRAILQESQFSTYLKEIKNLNDRLNKQANQAAHYLKINLNHQNLLIKKAFLNFDSEVQKRILLSYFKEIGQEDLLLKRKKNTLTEILKLLVNDKKPFLKLILKDQIIVKDFDELYLVDDYFFETFSLELNNRTDLQKIKNQK